MSIVASAGMQFALRSPARRGCELSVAASRSFGTPGICRKFRPIRGSDADDFRGPR